MKINRLIIFSIILSLLAAMPALAALQKYGPIIPYNAGPPARGNGYPLYYMDNNGVGADMQVPPFGDGLNSPTMIFGPVDPANPFSVDIGFDAEVFYFHVAPDRTTFDDLIGGNINVVIGVEAGFANATGLAENGQQAVWQRIRFNWVTAPDGFYRFLHPYGIETMTASGGAGFRYTVDTPILNIAPFNFELALGNNPQNPGKIGPFLSQVNPPPQIAQLTPPIPPPYNKPTDWLGDGTTAATFTGSPLTPAFNKFRIEAYTDSTMSTPLNVFPVAVGQPPTVNFVETDLAVIAGHRYHHPDITGVLCVLLLTP